jgi:hypothetical protein
MSGLCEQAEDIMEAMSKLIPENEESKMVVQAYHKWLDKMEKALEKNKE